MKKIRNSQVIHQALTVRKQFLGVDVAAPLCTYGLAEAMGFDVRFISIPTFEGLYIEDEKLILISSDRPEGRKRFTCAHEIGHHVLKHGTVIDEIIEKGSDKEKEREADLFAGMVLMPKSAVEAAAHRANIDIAKITPVEAYILSKYFGVTYSAFITHAAINLALMDSSKYYALKSGSPKSIRKEFITRDEDCQIIKIGSWWKEKSIDIEVGDYIVSDEEFYTEGRCLDKSNVGKNSLWAMKAVKTGVARIFTHENEWASFVRVSKKKYQGSIQYRFEEEAEDDN